MENNQLIYQKLTAINKEVRAVTKSRTNQQQGFKFRGIDDVMNELHELFAANEVIILQTLINHNVETRTTKSGSVQTLTRATFRYTFVTTDGSSVSIEVMGEAQDMGDKGMNKAMSIALKYALLQLFLIPTEDAKDPDAVTPEETDLMATAKAEIAKAPTKAALNAIYDDARFITLRGNVNFLSALTNRKNAIINEGIQA